MPVWINLRVPKLGGDALLKSLRDEMFKALGLFMHLFNWVIEYLIKKCLNEPSGNWSEGNFATVEKNASAINGMTKGSFREGAHPNATDSLFGFG